MKKEGLASLLDAPLNWPLAKGESKKEGGEAPLLKLLPPSPQGKGVRGMGSINSFLDLHFF
jgi:hypothetical protein